MAYDSSKPADSDLISASAANLRTNFAAIESGDDGFTPVQVALAEQGSDVSVISDTAIVYSKEVGSQSELFARNDNSTVGDSVVQLTDSGNIGATDQTYLFDSFSHDGTTTYNENNFITAWATVSSSGTLVDGVGLTSAKTATGKYTLTFSTAVGDTNYAVIAMSEVSNTENVVNYNTKAVGSFKITTRGGGGTAVDRAFSVMVLGGR